MDIDRFWTLIEQARQAAGDAADQAVRDEDKADDPERDYWDFDDEDVRSMTQAFPDSPGSPDGLAVDAGPDEIDDEIDQDEEDDVTDPVGVALFDLLAKLPAAEIALFDNIFEALRGSVDRADVANAALLIEHGFLGDESFDDFRAGLVALGRTAFEAARANPDVLADHPLVREIAAAQDPRWLGRADLLFVASYAYSAVTGKDEVTFYEFAEAHEPELAETEFEPAPVTDWDVGNVAVTRQRLPRLADMFFERSMRNRRRAMEKLGLAEQG